MLRTPNDRLRAEHARNHDGRMWLLIRPNPWIDEAIVEVLAFPAERTGARPRREDQIMRLVEHLAVVSRIGVIEDLLAASPAHPSGDQASMRDTVDGREFFGDAQRVLEGWQRIAEQDDAGFMGNARENRGLDVHHSAHAEGRAMMLVEHDRVKADLLSIDHLVKVFVIKL